MTPSEVLEAVSRIAGAGTVEAVWQEAVAAFGCFGFERVNYGYTRYRVGVGIGDPKDVFFLSTHAPDQVRWFHESGTYLKSADFRWVRDNVGACSWGWAHAERAAGRLSAGECAVMDQLGQGRARAGYSVSLPISVPRSKGAMGLAGAAGVSQAEIDALWQAQAAALMALAHVTHLKLSQMPLPVDGARLTARQREMLEYIADGKTLADVSLMTGLSPSMIDKHLAAARDKLGVETTAHAVAKVSFLNQLFVQGAPARG